MISSKSISACSSASNGLDVAWQIHGEYPAREYCVQYRESDFAFASRLMEDEGIYYFFEHREDGHTLILTDTLHAHKQVPGRHEVSYRDRMKGTQDEELVFSWDKRQRLVARRVTLSDYHFETPDHRLDASVETVPAVKVGQRSHRVHLHNSHQLMLEYPGDYAHHFDEIDPGGSAQGGRLDPLFSENRRIAAIRIQEEAAKGLFITGASHCGQFTAGHLGPRRCSNH